MLAIVLTMSDSDAAPACIITSFSDRIPFSRPSASTTGKRRTRCDFIVFNVIYQDGSLSSNRRIAKGELDIFEPDDSAKAIIEAQDRKIAALSGRPRGPIKSISRAAAR